MTTKNETWKESDTPPYTEPLPPQESAGDLALIDPYLAKLRALSQDATVQDVAAALEGLSKIRLSRAGHTLAREALINEVKRIKAINSPAKLVDALLPQPEGGKADHTHGQGRPLAFVDPDPWDEPVDGSALLAELCRFIPRFLVLPPGATTAIALWAIHSWCIDVAEHSPRLAILSPSMRCGKSTLLSVLGQLVRRPQPTAHLTPAPLFRMIEQKHPTLLIDEADSFVITSEELRGILNAGFDRGGTVIRCVGDNHEPCAFDVFTPTAIAAIRTLPDTIIDRSVVINMVRKLPREKTDRFRKKEKAEAAELRRKVARWIADNQEWLATTEVEPPAEANDRQADAWEPLQIIAAVAGGDWPQRTLSAFAALAKGQADSERQQLGEKLLADIRTAFGDRDRMGSKDILAALLEPEDSPWLECGKSKRPLTPTYMGRLLAPFGVKTKPIRDDSGKLVKGYRRADLEDSWKRYLGPVAPPSASAPPVLRRNTRNNPGIIEENSKSQGVTEGTCYALDFGEKPNDYGFVTPVTPWEGGTEGEGVPLNRNDSDPGVWEEVL